ncbi:hypothetical protein [Nafulsella turpanensis]|uniref:hypothetical protein n=1 Tax=Nafulsella turpanensis TaxID=1265690 RepID=UPI0003826298|nr:hypothetical protein [Nafulsella turpanensis]
MKKAQLSMLVQLATIDNELAGKESRWLQKIGFGMGMEENEINEIFRKPEPHTIAFTHLTSEERFEYLYNLIQLMKIDGKVFFSEIDFCKRAAEKLGYQSAVVKALSGSIFGDPAITADRAQLMKKAQKFLKIPTA